MQDDLIAPEGLRTPDPHGLQGRILAAIGAGTTGPRALREAFGVRGPHRFHKRLNETVELGWVERRVELTAAGRDALERMKRKAGA